jgi:elongator complex protein 4
LISSGLYDLDSIIGGGFSIGSLICLKEDSYSQYSQTILEYFISEGISNEQNICLVSSLDFSLNELPFNYSIYKQKNLIEEDLVEDKKEENEMELKIAWRYNEFVSQKISEKKTNIKQTNDGNLTKKSGTVGCHEYDLSKNIQEEILKENASKIKFIEYTNYKTILKNVYDALNENKENVTRICIRSLGILPQEGLFEFLYSLKSLVRNKMCVCFFSVPKGSFEKDDLAHISHISDIVLDMDSFTGKGVDPIEFKEFTGILTFEKLSKINSLNFNYSPDTLNFVFTRKKKKLYIERMYLPPEVSRATNQSDRPKFESKIKPTDIDF